MRYTKGFSCEKRASTANYVIENGLKETKCSEFICKEKTPLLFASCVGVI